jgi:TolB-like protein/Flp pilus assembly protein TadD
LALYTGAALAGSDRHLSVAAAEGEQAMAQFKVDLTDERLWCGDQPVQISSKAFQLLRLFICNPNRLLTKGQILKAVWDDVFVSEGLVKEYVHDLRQALGDDAKHPRFIETVRGRGYRFLGGIGHVERSSTGDARGALSTHALSLAILPFANLSDDPSQEYFADGISEDISIGLSKNPHLSVISRNSSFALKGKSMPAREIGKVLGAQFVLEGTVRKTGAHHLRVTAKLVDTVSERHLWAEAYDRKIDDLFAVQGEVVSAIIHALGATDGAIERSARQLVARMSNTDPTAYDCYLQAQGHFYRHGDSGYDEAEALYEAAIELDPSFARAYSGLAMLYFLRFKKYLTLRFESMEPKAHELAIRAERLDPDDYLAHWVLALLYSYLAKHSQGFAEFERALRINPNDANLLADFAEYLVYCGRADEALGHCQRAIRLNPNCPDFYWWNLGFTYFHLGRYGEALQSLDRMTSPDQARRLLAATYAQLGRIDEARSEADEFMNANPRFSIREWARTEPYIDPNELQRYVSGLRTAGLPE